MRSERICGGRPRPRVRPFTTHFNASFPLNIVCVIHSLRGGGAERVMAGLASRLAGRNHAVTLVLLDDGRSDRHCVAPDVKLVPLDLMRDSTSFSQRIGGNAARVRGLRKAISDTNPDVVLSFCDKTNLIVLVATIMTKTPVVVAERSDPVQQRLSPTWEFLRRRLYPRAAAVVALTDTSAASLQPLARRPVSVIASAVEPGSGHRVHADADMRNLVLGVGRLEWEKGFDRLIRAFAAATASRPEWTLRILGDGSQLAELQSLTESLGVSDRVAFPGWVDETATEYAQASVFALPSRYEGFPSALMEAMSEGVPCVSVDCESGPRAVIRNSDEAILVADQTDALTGGLERLMSDEVLRQRLSKAAPIVSRRFGWDAMTDGYEQILRQVSGNG